MSHALCAINSVFEKFIQCLSSFKLADITANCLYRGEYFAPLCSSAISRIKVGKKNLSRSRNNIFLPVSRFALFPLPAHEAKVGSNVYLECARGASTSATWSSRDNIHRATRAYFALRTERAEFRVHVQ